MKVLKEKWLCIAVAFAVIAVYMAIAFILPFNRSGLFWTGSGTILNPILVGACFVVYIAIIIGKDEITRVGEKAAKETSFMTSLRADTRNLVAATTDEETQKALKALEEALRYSDPVSSTALAAIENEMGAKATSLAESVAASDFDAARALAGEMMALITERNKQCKALK